MTRRKSPDAQIAERRREALRRLRPLAAGELSRPAESETPPSTSPGIPCRCSGSPHDWHPAQAGRSAPAIPRVPDDSQLHNAPVRRHHQPSPANLLRLQPDQLNAGFARNPELPVNPWREDSRRRHEQQSCTHGARRIQSKDRRINKCRLMADAARIRTDAGSVGHDNYSCAGPKTLNAPASGS